MPKYNGILKYTSIASKMLIIILIGVFGGIKLDEKFQFEKPVLTLTCSLLAVCLAMYVVIRDILREKKINIQLAIYTFLGLVVNFVILKWLQKDVAILLFSHFYFIIYTLLLFYYIEKTRENNRQFVSAFMGIFGAKLFISSIIVAVYLFLATNQKEVFAINFFAIYFYYSVFEVVKSYRLLKSI